MKSYTFTIRGEDHKLLPTYSARNYDRLTFTELIDELDWMNRHPALDFPCKFEITKNGKLDLGSGRVEWDEVKVDKDGRMI
jgi:hypothetical protein